MTASACTRPHGAGGGEHRQCQGASQAEPGVERHRPLDALDHIRRARPGRHAGGGRAPAPPPDVCRSLRGCSSGRGQGSRSPAGRQSGIRRRRPGHRWPPPWQRSPEAASPAVPHRAGRQQREPGGPWSRALKAAPSAPRQAPERWRARSRGRDGAKNREHRCGERGEPRLTSGRGQQGLLGERGEERGPLSAPVARWGPAWIPPSEPRAGGPGSPSAVPTPTKQPSVMLSRARVRRITFIVDEEHRAPGGPLGLSVPGDRRPAPRTLTLS